MNLESVVIPALALRPSSAPFPMRRSGAAAPFIARPWSQLSAAEKEALMLATFASTAELTGAAPLARSGLGESDYLAAYTVGQQQETERERARLAAEQAAQPWRLATGAVTSVGSAITAAINGETQRDLAEINRLGRRDVAEAEASAARYMADRNVEIARITAEAARLRAQGTPESTARAQQADQAIANLTQSQTQLMGMMANLTARREPQGLSRNAKIGIGVGAAAVIGLGVYFVTRKG